MDAPHNACIYAVRDCAVYCIVHELSLSPRGRPPPQGGGGFVAAPSVTRCHVKNLLTLCWSGSSEISYQHHTGRYQTMWAIYIQRITNLFTVV